ncbi:MAG: DUF6241 domain-containing protein [Carnobacterium sp.]|uniref:DUF6241 domain-containing protein n=1 Tax=Carnobacterium sp. TaxID=48221 RepID=UPI003315BFC9
MKKFLIGLVLTLFILSLLPLVIYITYQNIEEVEVTESIQEESIESEAVESSESVESQPQESHPARDESVPFVEAEEAFIQNMHDMTHQKVYAEDDHYDMEASIQGINGLLSILDLTNFEDENYYREVLTTWKEGDFSNAVEVHNKMVTDQGRPEDVAERLLTTEEEQEFVQINFR